MVSLKLVLRIDRVVVVALKGSERMVLRRKSVPDTSNEGLFLARLFVVLGPDYWEVPSCLPACRPTCQPACIRTYCQPVIATAASMQDKCLDS